MLCAGGCGAESGAVAAQSSLRPLGTRHQTSDCGFPVPSPAPPRVRVCGPSRETQPPVGSSPVPLATPCRVAPVIRRYLNCLVIVPRSLSSPVMKAGEAVLLGFLIKKVCVPQAHRKLFYYPWKPSSHQTFINYKKDKLLILLRVELSHSPSLPSSKCVFLKHREWKMENIWFALLGSEGHRLPHQWKGARETVLAGGGKDEHRRPRASRREPAGRPQQRGPMPGDPIPTPVSLGLSMPFQRSSCLKLTPRASCPPPRASAVRWQTGAHFVSEAVRDDGSS